MNKEERIQNERQGKEAKINSLMAKYKTEKEEIQEKMSELERRRPVLYAKVAMRQTKAKERDDLEAKLSKLQDREKRLVVTIRGLREILKELKNVNQSLTYFQEDRERFEELKGFIEEAEVFRPMWENEVRQFGEAKAKRVLSAFNTEQVHLMMLQRYIQELFRLAKELDEEASLREFIYKTTDKPIESFLEG